MLKILSIGIIIVGQFFAIFGNKPKARPLKNLHGNPFKIPTEQKRHNERQKFELMARIIKGRMKTDKSIKEIAADLSLAAMRAKK